MHPSDCIYLVFWTANWNCPSCPPPIKFTLLVAAADQMTQGGSGREKKQWNHLVQFTQKRNWFSRRKCCWRITLSPLNRRRIKLTSIGTKLLFWINSQKNNQTSSAGLSLQFSKEKALGTICWRIIVFLRKGIITKALLALRRKRRVWRLPKIWNFSLELSLVRFAK